MADERPYHHGDLDHALKAAAIDLITERGPSGFSLREVARRVGVSHAAPAHHFGDVRGLLTALAIEGFQLLTEALAAARRSTSDPRQRFVAIGVAYVEVGLARPGHLAIMFRKDLLNSDDPELLHWGLSAYGELERTLIDLRDEVNPALDVDRAARLAWSSVQGLLDLRTSLTLIAELTAHPIGDLSELAASFGQMLIDAFAPR